MANKQLHIRLDDIVYEELAEYAKYSGQTIQECISFAIMDLFEQQKQKRSLKNGNFTFIDLFAGIGGMRIALKLPEAAVYIQMNGTNTVSALISQTSVKYRTAT